MQPANIIVIDYAHFIGSVLYHGTITCIDGLVRSTWTYERDKDKVTEEGRVTADDYNYLWSLICDAHALRAFKITNANSHLDPHENHVFLVMVKSAKGQAQQTYQIPAAVEHVEPASSFLLRLRGPWTWEKLEKTL